MSTDQWVKLANAFNCWHFKPDVLEDELYFDEEEEDEDRSATIARNPNLSKESLASLDAESLDEFDEMDLVELETEEKTSIKS